MFEFLIWMGTYQALFFTFCIFPDKRDVFKMKTIYAVNKYLTREPTYSMGGDGPFHKCC